MVTIAVESVGTKDITCGAIVFGNLARVLNYNNLSDFINNK